MSDYDSDYTSGEGDPEYQYCTISAYFGNSTISVNPLYLKVRFNTDHKPLSYISDKFKLLFKDDNNFKFRNKVVNQELKIWISYNDYYVGVIKVKDFDFNDDYSQVDEEDNSMIDEYVEYSPHNLSKHKKEILDFLMNDQIGDQISELKKAYNLRKTHIKIYLRRKGLSDDLIEHYFTKNDYLFI